MKIAALQNYTLLNLDQQRPNNIDMTFFSIFGLSGNAENDSVLQTIFAETENANSLTKDLQIVFILQNNSPHLFLRDRRYKPEMSMSAISPS